MVSRRRKRPWAAPHPELDEVRARAGTHVERGPDGEWTVRQVSAAAATKSYTCPGCRQEIPPGTAHVVAWRSDHLLGVDAAIEDRRHWHSGCWRARGHRR